MNPVFELKAIKIYEPPLALNAADVVINLKNIIDSKEAEITARESVSESHKKLNGELRKELNQVKDDNKKLAKQIEDLEIQAKEMLAYP